MVVPRGSSEKWGVSVPVGQNIEYVVPGRIIVLCWVCYGLKTGFYPKKGGVESTTAGCNGGRCLVMPCERIGWGVGSARAACWPETS
eukprot:scaffold29377_cov168-Isochrysis_galbana.AAC.1